MTVSSSNAIISNSSVNDIRPPSARYCILGIFFMYISILVYPEFGLITELFCGYICCVLILAYITYTMIAIASYMLNEININYKDIMRNPISRQRRGMYGGHIGIRRHNSVPQIRHNDKVGGGTQFRGRRDLCGEITMRDGQ